MKVKKIITIFIALVVAALATASAHAGNAYYDNNGATAGSGNSSANWSTSTADWTYDATGSSATFVWSNGDSALFSAGSDQTASINVTTTSALTVSNILQNLGKVRILSGTGGGTLTMAGTSINLNTGQRNSGDYDLRVDPVIADSGSGTLITKTGPGVLLLENNNTFSGGFTLNAGTVGLEAAGGIFGSSTLTLNGGNLEKSWGNGSTATTIPNAISANGLVNLAVVQGNAGNLIFNGNVTGGSGGNITVSNIALNGLSVQGSTIFIAGDISGYSGTFSQTPGNNRMRFGPSSGSGSIVINGQNASFYTWGSTSSGNPIDMPDGTYGTFQMGQLSGPGGIIRGGWASAGNTTFQVGTLNTSTTYSGVIQDNPNGSAGLSLLNKVGTGTLTLSGPNIYSGGSVLSSGIVNLGIVQNGTTSGPLGKSGGISFAGGWMQYSVSNQFDYSPRFTNSTGPIAIDLNGTNVTFASPIGSSNTGGLALTNSTGTGKLTLTAANTYTGNTTIQAGVLVLSGSGSITASGNINVNNGTALDVSGVSFTVAANQTLAGSGTVTGAVMTAGISSSIAPGGIGRVGTLTLKNSLNLTSGGSPAFDLSTSHASGNDQVVVNGNLTLNSGTAVHINALSGSANLDQGGDYVLFSVGGTLSMTSQPSLAFDNTAPANAAHYSVKASGNNVVLHYSASSSPIVASLMVTNVVDGTATAVAGEPVTVYVTVTPGNGAVTNVSANLSSIGGSASQTLTSLGGNNYSYTTAVDRGTTLGANFIGVTATDTTPSSGSGSANLTVYATNEVWNGMGSDNNWSTGLNWVSSFAPGYSGDTLDFTGSTQTSPNMENNYSVAGLLFDGAAGSFTIGATSGKTLTLSGGVTNQSGSAQALNLPVALSGTLTLEDDNGAGLAFGGNISGTGGLTVNPAVNAGAVITLGGINTYTGNTTIPLFDQVNIANPAAIPSGVGSGTVTVNGTLNLSGTNATVNGLAGAGTIDNSSSGPVTLTVGSGGGGGTVSGTIQNSGGGALALVMTGTNNLTLSGNNTYSGGTTLSGGQITLGASSTGSGNAVTSGALGTGSVILNGGTLQMNAKTLGNNLAAASGISSTIDNSGGDGTFNGNVSGSGTITVQNSSGNSLSLKIGNPSLIPDWSGFNGTLNYNCSAGSGRNINIFAPGGALFDLSQVTLNVTNTAGNVNSSFRCGLGETVRIGTLAGPSGFLDTAGAFEIGALNTSTTYGGVIRDNGSPGGVTKVGTGSLMLGGASTYTGPTTISNGTLVVSSLSTGGGAYTVADGATLGVTSVSAGSLLVSNLTLGSGTGCTNNFYGVTSTATTIITNRGVLTLAGTVTVNIQGVLVLGQYPLIGSAGGISGTSGFVVGTLPLGTAATIVTNGNTIALNVTTAPAAQVWTGSVNTNWDYLTANWSLSGSPGVFNTNLSATFSDFATRATVNIATNVTALTIAVTNNAQNFTFASANGSGLSGSLNLVKSGTGTLTLLGLTNTFAGGFSINGGTVSIDGNGDLGGGVVDLAGGVLSPVQGFTLVPTLALGPVSGSGNGTINVGSGLTLTNNTAMIDYGSGHGTLVKTGSGTLQLGAGSTYTGGTVVSNGTLVLTVGGGAGAVRGTLTINPGATVETTVQDGLGYNGGQTATPVNIVGGTLDNQNANNQAYITTFNLTGGMMTSSGGGAYNFNGSSAGINSLSSSTVSTISAPIILRANNSNLTISTAQGAVPSGIDLNISGAISAGGGGGGSSAFTKIGNGTLALTGTNSYTGTTVVSNGTLLVNGSLAGGVTVNGGALAGTGTVSGAVTVNPGGTLESTVTGIGTIALNNGLSLGGNVLVKLNKNLSPAQSNDFINVTGALSYGGTLTVSNLGSALAVGNSFRIFPAGGTGSLTIVGNAGSGLAFSFSDGVLNVVTAGPSGPGTITNSVSGNTLTLSWPAGQGWKLQMQTNGLTTGLGTNWVYVTDGSLSSTNITIDPAKPTVFYRLAYP